MKIIRTKGKIFESADDLGTIWIPERSRSFVFYHRCDVASLDGDNRGVVFDQLHDRVLGVHRPINLYPDSPRDEVLDFLLPWKSRLLQHHNSIGTPKGYKTCWKNPSWFLPDDLVLFLNGDCWEKSVINTWDNDFYGSLFVVTRKKSYFQTRYKQIRGRAVYSDTAEDLWLKLRS